MFDKIRNKYNNIIAYYQYKCDIILGYISENGEPLKCRSCGSYEIINSVEYFDDYILCEYGVKCGKCGKQAGHWAYGNWMH